MGSRAADIVLTVFLGGGLIVASVLGFAAWCRLRGWRS